MSEIKEKKIVMTESQLDDFNDKMLRQSIDGINEAAARERTRTLADFSTVALEDELLRRKKVNKNKK